MSELDDLMQAMQKDAKRQQQQQRDSVVIDWVRAHWQLFVEHRSEMEMIYRALGSQFEFSPEGLAEGLALPEYIHLVKLKQEDLAPAFCSFPKSHVLELFLKCCDAHKDRQALLIGIVGVRAIVVTNKDTKLVPGLMSIALKSLDDMPDIHLFNWQDAPMRMPWLFVHKSN